MGERWATFLTEMSRVRSRPSGGRRSGCFRRPWPTIWLRDSRRRWGTLRRAPAVCGTAGLLTNIAAYGLLKLAVPEIQFLNRMAVCFALSLVVMAAITLVKPLSEPVVFKQNTAIALETSRIAKIGGVLVIATALLFYFLFSTAGLAG